MVTGRSPCSRRLWRVIKEAWGLALSWWNITPFIWAKACRFWAIACFKLLHCWQMRSDLIIGEQFIDPFKTASLEFLYNYSYWFDMSSTDILRCWMNTYDFGVINIPCEVHTCARVCSDGKRNTHTHTHARTRAHSLARESLKGETDIRNCAGGVFNDTTATVSILFALFFLL